MKFKHVLEDIAQPAMSTGDVQGIQADMGRVVKRKVGISRTKISSTRKKKKNEFKRLEW